MSEFEHKGTLKHSTSNHYTVTLPKGVRSFSVKTEKEEPFIFKAGDIVNYYPYGDREFELKANTTHLGDTYSLTLWTGDYEHCFTLDGKEYVNQPLSSLTLVRRPKKMVEKVVTRWMNVYDRALTPNACYESKELADSHAMNGRVAYVELKGSYWVEE